MSENAPINEKTLVSFAFMGHLFNKQQEEMESEPDHGAIDALNMEITRLEEVLSQNSGLATLNKSREGFNQLMQEVNGVLEATLNPQEEFEDGGCGAGGCAGCSGCGPER